MSKNEELGLPFNKEGKMERIIVAFDVDGTLIDENCEVQKEHSDWHAVLRTVSKAKNVKVVVWSGGGKKYAESIGMRYGLDKYVWSYASKTEWKEIREMAFVIAIDDIQDTAIGNINLIVRNK